jgi:hypothetical protein
MPPSQHAAQAIKGAEMKILNTRELLIVSGGDIDDDEGEAEARAFYEKYGVCEQWKTAEGDTWYSCTKQDGSVSLGNIGGPGSATGMPDSTNRTPDWGPNAPPGFGLNLTRPSTPGLKLNFGQ